MSLGSLNIAPLRQRTNVEQYADYGIFSRRILVECG